MVLSISQRLSKFRGDCTWSEQFGYIYICLAEVSRLCLIKIKKKIVSISVSGLERILRLLKQIKLVLRGESR